MEEQQQQQQLNSLAVTQLLQHTLRSLCLHENSQWVYAVFWRILPRNYPPPKWDSLGGVYDRSRGNRRNWILVWEDGFCNFAASAAEATGGGTSSAAAGSSSVYANCDFHQFQGLQPELFFKMSHEIYNYGEGLIGKVAADHSHKWIHNEPNDQEVNFLSAWHSSADSHPRTWEAQFQSGIKTIALVAVREGVIQLGSVHKVMEDLSYVVLLRKKLSYIESIPGVLLPYPSSSSAAYPSPLDSQSTPQEVWHHHLHNTLPPTNDYSDHIAPDPMKITPSMSSLEALLSKLPSVVPISSPSVHFEPHNHHLFSSSSARPFDGMAVAKEEYDEEESQGGETSSASVPPPYHHNHNHHHHLHQFGYPT